MAQSSMQFPRMSAIWMMLAWAVVINPSIDPACAGETVTFRSDKKDLVNGAPMPVRTVTGEIMIEAKDGGLMLRSDDGRIWMLQPDQITDRVSDDQPVNPVSADEMAARMADELPPGFTVYQTNHYLIVHNTTPQYAKQVGTLFEQLYRSFYTYWKNQRWRLPDPEFPLVALVLADQNDFLKHAGAEVGSTAQSVIGYYHLSSNRMTTYRVPNLERNVATIIHEATHQLAYNCGVQTRFADNPMWVSEGMAMFFESPDFSGPKWWQGIGRVNHVNLQRWRDYLPRRPANSLISLLSDDTRFRDVSTAEDAYGESWALTYFLMKTRREEYVAYLKKLSEGKPLHELSPRERIEMFEEVFGTTVSKIDRGLVSYMRRVR